MKQIIKTAVLYLLLLGVMVLCGTFVLKVYDMLLGLGFEDIWTAGFKVGFLAWAVMLILIYRRRVKDKNK